MPTTVSLDEAIQALKDGRQVSHKCLPSTEHMYLNAFGRLVGNGRLCLLEGLDMDLDMFRERMGHGFDDGWIIEGLRYGEPDEALEWMKQGGLARLPSNLKMDYCFWRDDMVYCRRTSGHEWRYASEPSWNFNQWTAEPYILLPPTCKKLTYEELERHLEKGGRWQWRWHFNNANQGCANYWFYKNKDHHMFHHLHGKDLDVTLRYGEWGEGISVGNLKDVVLLPPLEEEPKPEPKLEPKTDATFEEAKSWLEMGGRARREGDRYSWFDIQDGQVYFHGRHMGHAYCDEPDRYGMFHEDDFGWTLLPEPSTRLQVIEHLSKGGRVRWTGGVPGHWKVRYDTLYWLPCGAKRAVVSKHNCDGHWFASFEDWEIEHLELLSKEPPKDSMTRDEFMEFVRLLEREFGTCLIEQETSDNPSPAEIIEHLLDGGTVRETTRKGRTAIFYMLDGTTYYLTYTPAYHYRMKWEPVSEMQDALRLAQKSGTRYELL